MYILVRTPEAFEATAKLIDFNKPIHCDTETCKDLGKTDGGLYGKVRMVQLYQYGWDNAILIDCFFINLHKVLDLLQPSHLVFHNASYDLHTINCYTKKTWLPKKLDDTFYLSKAHFWTKDKFDFYKCLDYAKVSDETIRGIDKKANQTTDWSKELTPTLLMYAACDVLYLSLLYNIIEESKDESYALDIANLEYAVNYDRKGLPINQDTLAVMRQKNLLQLEKYSSKVPVNINSPKQCKEWLGTDATDATTLGVEALTGNEDAENLIQARKAHKLSGFIDKYDHPRIRAFHNACGARTSRMTCNGGDRYFYENNQNPPRHIFPAIEAPDGKTIIYKDYSGLELRMAVAYVGEPAMAAMMMKGLDLHTYTGCHLFDKTPETLPKYERTVTKFFNFGTVYGAGTNTLRALLRAQGRIDLPRTTVDVLRTKWLGLYSYFESWHDLHKKYFNVYGYVDTTTGLGRNIRATYLPDSYNFPIQGSSAEVTKMSLYYLHTSYPEQPTVINVVHDSIALEQDVQEADMWVERLNECMIKAWYYVIKDMAIPDLVMPPEAQHNKTWEFA